MTPYAKLVSGGLGGLVLGLLLLAFSPEPQSASPAASSQKTVEIKAISGLQYDQVRFAAEPGQRVQLVLENASSLPHNLLITAPGARMSVVEAAAQMENGLDRDYAPDSDSVLHAIPVLDPGKQDTLSFAAPKEEGVYPYVCTFPGHGTVMYGAMYVSGDGNESMPPLADDPHVPADRLRTDASDTGPGSQHPYSTDPPFMYHTFMPESSPASIAVGLENGISYCFDATPVMLRYAWRGGFLDNSEVFKGHVSEQRAELEGETFYRNDGSFPLRLGENAPPDDVSFDGYRMVDERPQFLYTVDDVQVRELITPTDAGTGLRRTFQIPDAEETVRFIRSPHEDVTIDASAGSWDADTLRLRPSEAQEFTVTVTHDSSGPLSSTDPQADSSSAQR
jgi:azurin